MDESGQIIRINQSLAHAGASNPELLAGKNLRDLINPTLLETFWEAMSGARQGRDRQIIFSIEGKRQFPIPLSATMADVDGQPVYFFFGNLPQGLSMASDWEKEERIKELACLYAMAEWIEVSASIKEFLTHLPKYLTPGMHYPEKARIYSVYQGQEYGEKIEDRYISTPLQVKKQIRGEIRVGYPEESLELLAEEQKMLSEIGRILNLALERKELSQNLQSKEAEEAELTRRVRELEKEITARTSEFEKQRKNLETVNATIDRVKSDWAEAQRRLMTLFQAIPDQVAIIDRHHNVIMTNQSHVQTGDKCHKTFFNRDIPCQDCRLVRVIRDKSPIRTEIKHEDEYYEVQSLPIFNEADEVEWITEFYRNITREKTYEQQLQQADKLASIGQLVSGIGHEINNPNQFIRGNIKIVQQAMEDMLPIVDEHYRLHSDLKIARLKYDFFRQNIMTLVTDMAHGSKRIKDIIDGLKQFSRRDEGELIDNVELNTIIDAAARLVHNEVHKSADIELQLAPDLPTFTGNIQKMEQVLINLIINAAQAMPDDRRGLIWVSTRLDDGHVVITVKDNGKGMSERTLKQIFDPFFTTRRAKGGTGLGLPIVYRIMEEHSGTISVTSKPDVGTTFTLRLPLKRRAAAGKAGESVVNLVAEPKEAVAGEVQ